MCLLFCDFTLLIRNLNNSRTLDGKTTILLTPSIAPPFRELSIVKNIFASTLNLGLWWESESIDVLNFLHYKCGMPAEMMRQHIIEPAAAEQDPTDESENQNDWREFNKAPQGVTYQTAIYTPLTFRKQDPRWKQHWLMNALGTCFNNCYISRLIECTVTI
jgi:hypothetical protein